MTTRIRRLIAGVFILLFFVVAPLLLFYAAGYRYSLTTHQIVQSGTFVLSTIPRGADIILNGTPTGSQTPDTITSQKPGTYTVSLQKQDYFSWTKKFSLHQKEAVFATDIKLFKKASPTRFEPSPLSYISANQTGDLLLVAASGRVGFYSAAQQSTIWLSVSKTTNVTDSQWSPDGRNVLLATSEGYVIAQSNSQTATSLKTLLNFTPVAAHWTDRTRLTIISTDGRQVKFLDFATRSVTAQSVSDKPIGGTITDVWAAGANWYAVVQQKTGPAKLYFSTVAQPSTSGGSAIEGSNDHIVGIINDTIIFHSDDQQLSLWRINGTSLLPLTKMADVRNIALSIPDNQIAYTSGFELWTYNTTSATNNLLTRLPHPIDDLKIYPSGSYILFASDGGLNAIEQDGRDIRNSWELARTPQISALAISFDGSKLWFVSPDPTSGGLFELPL